MKLPVSIGPIGAALGLAGCVAMEDTGASAPPRPNIVLVITDDQGLGDFSCMGNDVLETPHLDRLAAESTRLTQFYTHSVCAPTRGAFLTGRYAFRNWMDWRSEDFGKPTYLARLGLTLALQCDIRLFARGQHPGGR